MTDLAPIWKYAEINPVTPEFKSLYEGAEVSFMPLEAVWPGARADYRNTLPWAPKLSYTQFRRGDILVPKITPTFEAGRTIIAEIPSELGLASTEVHVVRANDDSDPRFLQYCFQSLPFLDEGAHSLQGVGNLRRITPRFVQDHKVLDASLETQRAIADYLDRETGEIDAMIAKMDELAETLDLRRFHAIVEAVHSPRRTSIGMLVDVTLGKMLQTSPKAPTDRLQPYLRAAHVQPGGRLDFDVMHKEMWFSHRERQLLDLRSGDAVIVEGGAGFGRVAFLHQDLEGWGFQNSIIRLRGASPDIRYLVYALQAALQSGEIAMACNAATFAHFTAEKVESFRIPFHDPDQRSRIADHLDEVTGKIDAMLAKVAELKSLLIERRAALITDVVTGRKKVA